MEILSIFNTIRSYAIPDLSSAVYKPSTVVENGSDQTLKISNGSNSLYIPARTRVFFYGTVNIVNTDDFYASYSVPVFLPGMGMPMKPITMIDFWNGNPKIKLYYGDSYSINITSDSAIATLETNFLPFTQEVIGDSNTNITMTSYVTPGWPSYSFMFMNASIVNSYTKQLSITGATPIPAVRTLINWMTAYITRQRATSLPGYLNGYVKSSMQSAFIGLQGYIPVRSYLHKPLRGGYVVPGWDVKFMSLQMNGATITEGTTPPASIGGFVVADYNLRSVDASVVNTLQTNVRWIGITGFVHDLRNTLRIIFADILTDRRRTCDLQGAAQYTYSQTEELKAYITYKSVKEEGLSASILNGNSIIHNLMGDIVYEKKITGNLYGDMLTTRTIFEDLMGRYYALRTRYYYYQGAISALHKDTRDLFGAISIMSQRHIPMGASLISSLRYLKAPITGHVEPAPIYHNLYGDLLMVMHTTENISGCIPMTEYFGNDYYSYVTILHTIENTIHGIIPVISYGAIEGDIIGSRKRSINSFGAASTLKTFVPTPSGNAIQSQTTHKGYTNKQIWFFTTHQYINNTMQVGGYYIHKGRSVKKGPAIAGYVTHQYSTHLQIEAKALARVTLTPSMNYSAFLLGPKQNEIISWLLATGRTTKQIGAYVTILHDNNPTLSLSSDIKGTITIPSEMVFQGAVSTPVIAPLRSCHAFVTHLRTDTLQSVSAYLEPANLMNTLNSVITILHSGSIDITNAYYSYGSDEVFNGWVVNHRKIEGLLGSNKTSGASVFARANTTNSLYCWAYYHETDSTVTGDVQGTLTMPDYNLGGFVWTEGGTPPVEIHAWDVLSTKITNSLGAYTVFSCNSVQEPLKVGTLSTYFFATRKAPTVTTNSLLGSLGWEPVYSRFRMTSVLAVDPNALTFFARNGLMASILPAPVHIQNAINSFISSGAPALTNIEIVTNTDTTKAITNSVQAFIPNTMYRSIQVKGEIAIKTKITHVVNFYIQPAPITNTVNSYTQPAPITITISSDIEN